MLLALLFSVGIDMGRNKEVFGNTFARKETAPPVGLPASVSRIPERLYHPNPEEIAIPSRRGRCIRLAFVSGVVCTLLVPVLVPLFL